VLKSLKALDFRMLRDRCRLAPLAESPVGSGAETEKTWTPGVTTYRCLMQEASGQGGGKERDGGAQIPVADRSLLLEPNAAPTVTGHIFLDSTHGTSLSPSEEWEIVGKPFLGPSGWTLSLRNYEGGNR